MYDTRLSVAVVKLWRSQPGNAGGDGRGRIRAARDLGTASDRSYSGGLADIDRDGDRDVVVSNDTPDPKLV